MNSLTVLHNIYKTICKTLTFIRTLNHPNLKSAYNFLFFIESQEGPRKLAQKFRGRAHRVDEIVLKVKDYIVTYVSINKRHDISICLDLCCKNYHFLFQADKE